MLCPACRQEMLTLEFRLIEVDHCPACGGVWLDSGELALVAEHVGAPRLELISALESGEACSECSPVKRRCPVCAKRMERVRVPGAPEVTVDRCKRRHGVWFDEGELDTAVQAAGAAQGNEMARFLAELEEQRRKNAPQRR